MMAESRSNSVCVTSEASRRTTRETISRAIEADPEHSLNLISYTGEDTHLKVDARA